MKPKSASKTESWHNGAEGEINLYAASLQRAARALVKKLEQDRDARIDWDIFPITFLYREAVELQLKALASEGSNFLEKKIAPIMLSRNRSLRRLARIVCHIIEVVKWERQFVCDSVWSLADFSALVNELEALDPVSWVVRSPKSGGYSPVDVVQFASRLDALLDLLAATTHALAVKRDEHRFMTGAETELPKLRIH